MASKPSNANTSVLPEGKLRNTKYRKVLDHLYAEIHSGRLQPGAPLPTDLDLSETLGMSRNTVRHAFDKLVQEGVVYRVPGRGTFITTVQQRQARQQIDVFALIAPELRDGFYPSLVHGFEQTSGAIHHQVIVGSSGNDTGRQADLILQMIDRSVGGVALVPTTTAVTPAYQIRQLQKNQIPVVFCHRNVEGVAAPCVTWSGQEVGRQAGVALTQKGHRHLGWLLNPTRRTPLANDYEIGLRAAIAEIGASEGKVTTIEYCSPDVSGSATESIKRALHDVLSKPDRPTAIFCGNMPDAEQVYLQAEAFGLKIPRDLSLVAFGGTWRPHGLAERISCIAVDEYAVGTKAAEMLHEMRSGKRALDSDERIVFPVSLLPGETIGSAA